METRQSLVESLSVIVPVYNKAEHLDICLSSLDQQTADPSTFEVLIIDDGSTDDSLDICRAFAQEHGNVRIISQENQGVSAARNKGISEARGDVFLFLDADDAITPATVEEMLALFAAHDGEFDLATYRLNYHNAILNTVTEHPRARWFKESGTYPLDEHPYISQATMNVCVRNRGADNILFDTGMRTCEDQLYITRNLERTGAIGYCDAAAYSYYAIGVNGAIQRLANPLYSYEEMLALFRYLLELAQTNEAMRKYAYALILYNVDWRLRSNRLFPQFADDDQRPALEEELDEILRAIPHTSYAASSYINAHHKAYLLKRYVHPEHAATVEHTDKKTYVTFEDESTWGTAQAKVVIEQCRFRNGKLRLQGRVTCPAFWFESRPSVRFTVGDSKIEASLEESSFSYVNSRMPLGRIWWLDQTLDLSGLSNLNISVELVIDGSSVAYELENGIRDHNARIVKEAYCFPGLKVTFAQNSLITEPVGKMAQKMLDASANRHDEQGKAWRKAVLEADKDFQGKPLWLYADDPMKNGGGDALAQMLHDLRANDGVERFYACENEAEIVSRHPSLEGRVVQLGSEQHKKLFLLSEACIFTSPERAVRNPLESDELAAAGDLAHAQMRVYMHDGVLHACRPWKLSRDRQLADVVVASTEAEAGLYEKLYGYPSDAIALTGLPRFDQLAHEEGCKGRKIIYAPSWRSFLLTASGQDWLAADNRFAESTFFRGLESLCALFEESSLKEGGYSLDIKLHPRFGCYRSLVEPLCSEAVRLVEGDVNLYEYEAAITDYSSYAYELAYAGCNIVYFVPDLKEFRAGLHEYSEVAPPLEEGFGPLCTDAGEALDAVRTMFSSSGEAANAYRERRDALLSHLGGSCCDILYEELCKRLAYDA